MNDPILLRKLIREALAMAPTRRIPESILFKSVEQLALDKLKVTEFAEARNWNQSKGYIESRFNEDREEAEWFLTDAGKQKESL